MHTHNPLRILCRTFPGDTALHRAPQAAHAARSGARRRARRAGWPCATAAGVAHGSGFGRTATVGAGRWAQASLAQGMGVEGQLIAR